MDRPLRPSLLVLLRTSIVIAVLSSLAPACELSSQQIKQGDAVRLTCDSPASSAFAFNRSFALFPQGNGKMGGLLPIPVGATPGSKAIQVRSSGGRTLNTLSVQVIDARFEEQNVTLSRSLSSLRPAPGDNERLQRFRKLETPERFWSEPFQIPVPGCMTSPFGVQRMHNGKRTGSYHGGIDQRSPSGEPIHAIAAGVVRLAGKFSVPGNTVGVDHGQGLTSMYMHMSKIEVAEGAHVKAGDVLGYVGSTGRSTAPHLHWGMAAYQMNINPMQWVSLTDCPAPKPVRKRRKRR